MNAVIRKIALVILAIFCCGTGYGQCDPILKTDSAEIVFDGTVNKFVVQDNFMYAGGQFNTVGKFSGSFIELDKRTGAAVNRRAWPKVNGPSNAIADGSGNYIVYGSFDKVNGDTRQSLAVITGTGTVTSFNATINGAVNAAVIYGGKLYIGGDFTMVNGTPRNRLASIDLSNGMLMPWDPNVSNTGPLPCKIACMVLDGTNLYLGGAFSDIGSTPRKNIAVLDIITGTAGTWAPQAYFAGSPNIGTVSKMLKVNNQLYICGSFDFTGGGIHGDVAGIDLTTGLAISWSPNPNSAVLSLASKGDSLYLGGAFSQISGLPRQGFAAYSIASGSLLPIAINTKKAVQDRIYSILPVGDTIYLGGSFDTINNQLRKNIASFNRLTGAILPFKSFTNGDVTGLVNDNGKLYATGKFYSVDRKVRNYLASIDIDADTISSWAPSIDGPVSNLEIRNKILYISGYFTKLNDSLRSYNAAWDILRSRVLRWNPKANGPIHDIQLYKNDVYVGGTFKSINGNTRYGLAKLDTAGNLQPWIGITDTLGRVNKLGVYKDTLYVGGRFNDIGGQMRKACGGINLATGLATLFTVLEAPFITDVKEVNTFILRDDMIYVAGEFEMADTLMFKKPGVLVYDTLRSYSDYIASYHLNYNKALPYMESLELWWPLYFPKFDGDIKDMFFITNDVDDRLYVSGAFQHAQAFPHQFIDRRGICIFHVPPPHPPGSKYRDTVYYYHPPPLPPLGPPFRPPVYAPNILPFDYELRTQSINTMCYTGNKLFFGGELYDGTKGYENAAFFFLPYGELQANLSVDTNGVCSGIPTTLHAHSSLTYGVTYHWNINGVNISKPSSYHTITPNDKDSVSCVVTMPSNGCLLDMQDTTNSIVFAVTQTVIPDINITSVIEEESGKQVTVKAVVKDAATGYSIEWFNKGVSLGKTSVDSIVYTKGSGTDSIYAVITPRPDTCYVTDTSGLIVINEKPVGIGNITGDARVMVYPNPFDTYVKVSGLERGDILILYDVTGRKISTATSTSKEYYLLETGKLKPGIYVLKITDPNGMLRKSILIQKQ